MLFMDSKYNLLKETIVNKMKEVSSDLNDLNSGEKSLRAIVSENIEDAKKFVAHQDLEGDYVRIPFSDDLEAKNLLIKGAKVTYVGMWGFTAFGFGTIAVIELYSEYPLYCMGFMEVGVIIPMTYRLVKSHMSDLGLINNKSINLHNASVE